MSRSTDSDVPFIPLFNMTFHEAFNHIRWIKHDSDIMQPCLVFPENELGAYLNTKHPGSTQIFRTMVCLGKKEESGRRTLTFIFPVDWKTQEVTCRFSTTQVDTLDFMSHYFEFKDQEEIRASLDFCERLTGLKTAPTRKRPRPNEVTPARPTRRPPGQSDPIEDSDDETVVDAPTTTAPTTHTTTLTDLSTLQQIALIVVTELCERAHTHTVPINTIVMYMKNIYRTTMDNTESGTPRNFEFVDAVHTLDEAGFVVLEEEQVRVGRHEVLATLQVLYDIGPDFYLDIRDKVHEEATLSQTLI
mmetsp:Transcript_12764/g.26107  ORF Transcript_12764/g.26107 Transcript_12764/m.26107 type:complete len:303 (+) Transcript_12764:60-968(+)